MDRDYSSIKILEKTVQLALPITFISNEFSGVLETLETWKRQYNPQLEGILVNYSNVYLMSRANKVIISRNVIIIDVKAMFHIFCPKVGDVVKGKVNRITPELVGCIMHDTINATIYLSNYCPVEAKKFIRIEREILFEITHFSCFRNEVRVQGKITPDCLRLMTELFTDVEEEVLTNFSFQNENTITNYNFSNEIEECQVFKSEISTIDIDESPAELKEEPNSEPVHKKSKKRKLDTISDEPSKKKRKKDASSEFNIVNGASAISEDVPVLKNEAGTDDESNLNNVQPILKRHKKQKLSKDEQRNKKPKKEKKSKKSKIIATGTVVKSDKKKPKKEKKSKKSKIIATGTVVKSDKNKLNKKHSKKDKHNITDKKLKTKKGHKKAKKKKLSDKLLDTNVQIKSE
ncbi:DNA-directed RNA polymerase I subunit RPA43-like [Parasteatoda tepidariorum]|uniref:DNA-directed RNA polymerase I subunit RPA43-like n=1 Tax=Parasteatoda tepidariorum TaxID=114398 RepID=UPI00077FB528|nr:DNA-directed RNA polymerase I subunit RPA43-like [Parasteatoda tepidariorum]